MGAENNFGARARQRAKLFVLLLGASAAMLFAACGLDDSAITQISSGVDGSIIDTGTVTPVGEAGKPIVDSGEPDVFVCTPETCTSYPSVCRPGLANGCGGDIDCTNACPSGQACISDSGTCDGPPVCLDAGAPGGNCGTLTNPGNGLTAACGSCTNGYGCTSSACTCAGTTCGAGGATCCVTASATPSCNTTSGTCCKKKTCAVDYANTCNSTNDDGCGGNLDCSGSCGSGTTCDTTNHTCCSPETTAAACGNNCSTTVQNNCHKSVTCGATCAITNETCSGTTCSCPNTTCNSACCTSGQVCNDNACCTKTCAAYACGATSSDGCGGSCSCTLPDYNTCGVAGLCYCDSSAGSCSACTGGETQCSFGTGNKYKYCVTGSCPP